MAQQEGSKEMNPLYSGLPLTNIQILVVDDEGDTRDLLAFILTEAGAQVTTVPSAQAALALFEQFRFDILLSDIGMPGVDGYTLLRQVRSRSLEAGGGIPAIALTAYASEIDQDRAIATGFQKHLSKPIDPSELVAIITAVTQQ